jgi:hypothetical protein
MALEYGIVDKSWLEIVMRKKVNIKYVKVEKKNMILNERRTIIKINELFIFKKIILQYI